jgi:hypothetical protein
MTRKRFQSGLMLPAVLLLAGCSHYIPAHDPQVQGGIAPQPVQTTQVVQPVYPSERTVVIPSHQATPPVTVVTPSRSVTQTSMIPMTLTGDLTPLQNQLRLAMPESLTDAGHPLNQDFRWNFVRSGQPQVTVHNGMITVRGEYVGSIESTNNTSLQACRLNPVYPVIEETANMDVRQVGNEAHISMVNPRMRVWLKPESDQRCNMFNMPLQDGVRNLINADKVHARLVDSLEQSRLRIRTDFADSLRGPLAYTLLPSNTQLCIYPSPQEVKVGQLEGDARHATLRTVAVIQPTTTIGNPCPAPAATQPVPVRFGTMDTMAPAGQTVTIVSGILMPYSKVSEIIDSKLSGQGEPSIDQATHPGNSVPSAEFALGDQGETVRIERVVAQDAGGKVLLTVETSGYLKGSMYFWGTPRIQTLPNGHTALTIPDLQMDSETKRMLDHIDAGLGARADQRMTPRIRDAAYINLTDRIAYVQNAVSYPYRNRDMTVTFQPVRLAPENVYSTPQGLVTDVTMETTANAEGRFYIISAG